MSDAAVVSGVCREEIEDFVSGSEIPPGTSFCSMPKIPESIKEELRAFCEHMEIPPGPNGKPGLEIGWHPWRCYHTIRQWTRWWNTETEEYERRAQTIMDCAVKSVVNGETVITPIVPLDRRIFAILERSIREKRRRLKMTRFEKRLEARQAKHKAFVENFQRAYVPELEEKVVKRIHDAGGAFGRHKKTAYRLLVPGLRDRRAGA